MSGSDVPYQLRPNKFVERQLFVELLEHIDRMRPIADHAYVSMGGRFLEDHKLLHARFRMKQLFSIEGCVLTYDRQVFNRPFAVIRCHNETSGEFVNRLDKFLEEVANLGLIVWLDYTEPGKRLEQLRELETLVSKLRAYDLVKVTMNAAPHTLGDKPAEFLKQQLDEYAPSGGIGRQQTTAEGLPNTLAEAIKKAVLRGIEGTPDCEAVPLSVFRYADSKHQMLTHTAIVLPADSSFQVEFFNETCLDKWEFRANHWTDVVQISVPDLSPKERRFIDEMLFTEPLDQLHARLSFKFHNKNQVSLEHLQQYLTHYRRYPNFVFAGG